ncbi:MAG: xanthine dehydrogenase family protein subunit M [Chloroflexi bacterium]|nr:xanthine dehydrogenase family protein subunit M [Chloroflexota bacterium]
MRLPPFQLHRPETLQEAVSLLAQHGEEARPIAGGTAMVPMMRFGFLRPEHVVSLKGIPGLDEISESDDGLRIGALTPLYRVAGSAVVRAQWPLLARAVGSVATPAIRNSGTLGGNLSYAEAASDPAPALLALEASVLLTGPEGDRTVPITGFFQGFYEADIRPGEVLVEVSIPRIPAGARWSYLRFAARSREDKPLVNVAVVATSEGVRIGLGGVSPTAIRARRAEAVLQGPGLTPQAIDEAADAAAEECDPLSDLMGTAEYRQDMVRVWLRRALTGLQ